MRMRIGWIIVLALVMLPSVGAAADTDCEPVADIFGQWFTAPPIAVFGGDDPVRVDDAAWGEVYEGFLVTVLEYAAACAGDDLDLSYEAEFRGGETPVTYDVLPAVTALDVNLDGDDEWLVSLQVGSQLYGSAQGFSTLLYHYDDDWLTETIWPLADLDNTRAQYPTSIYIHEEPDINGRTYMGVAFMPGIGPAPDPYVGGLVVLRWDGWSPETVLLVEQGCVFSNWATGSDGGLYIPVSGSIPWQGCTVPLGEIEDGLQIPGAEMPRPSDGDS